MTKEQIERITELRAQNFSYQFIADALSLPMNTVKSYCLRHGIAAEGKRKTKDEKQHTALCRNCRKILEGGRSDRIFCSKACRAEWHYKNMKIITMPSDVIITSHFESAAPVLKEEGHEKT